MLYDFVEHGLKKRLEDKKQTFLELSVISHEELTAGIYSQTRSIQLMTIHEEIKSLQKVLDSNSAQ